MALPNNPTPSEVVKAIKDLEAGGGAGGTVDSAISPTSENPVQNKAIYAALPKVIKLNSTAQTQGE